VLKIAWRCSWKVSSKIAAMIIHRMSRRARSIRIRWNARTLRQRALTARRPTSASRVVRTDFEQSKVSQHVRFRRRLAGCFLGFSWLTARGWPIRSALPPITRPWWCTSALRVRASNRHTVARPTLQSSQDGEHGSSVSRVFAIVRLREYSRLTLLPPDFLTRTSRMLSKVLVSGS
jgi:hypothetical protein